MKPWVSRQALICQLVVLQRNHMSICGSWGSMEDNAPGQIDGYRSTLNRGLVLYSLNFSIGSAEREKKKK